MKGGGGKVHSASYVGRSMHGRARHIHGSPVIEQRDTGKKMRANDRWEDWGGESGGEQGEDMELLGVGVRGRRKRSGGGGIYSEREGESDARSSLRS